MSKEYEKWLEMKAKLTDKQWRELKNKMEIQEDIFLEGFSFEYLGEDRDYPYEGDAMQSDYTYYKVDGILEIRGEAESHSECSGGIRWIQPIRHETKLIEVNLDVIIRE